MKGFFIVGMPRSGTTLLQSAFLRSDEVLTFPETHFFNNLMGYSERLGFTIPGTRTNLYKNFSDAPNKKVYFLLKNNVLNFISNLDKLKEINHKSYWLEKTPRHLHYISLLSKYYNDLFFIHIIREPFSNIASLYEVTHKYPKEWSGERSLEECIKRWNKDTKESAKYINNSNHIFVRYEDLSTQYDLVIKKIFSALNINFIDTTKNEENLKVESITEPTEKWKANNSKKVEMAIDKSKKIFDKDQLQFIQSKLNYKYYNKISFI